MKEFPDLETTYRMFRGRDFDLVTVSTNLPDERAGVMKALAKQHASSRNLSICVRRHLCHAGGLRRQVGIRCTHTQW